MAKSSLSIDFKSSTFFALKLVLQTADTDTLVTDLNKRIEQAGDFYAGEAIAIDITGLDSSPDWPVLIKAIKNHQMHPIGVYCNPNQETIVASAGLATLEAVGTSKAKDTTSSTTPEGEPKPEPVANTTTGKKSMLIKHPLRSGQSIYARDCDLIILGMVSKGAEVIADGNIHVYGPLRGKAIAGAKGDTNALILTTQLDAELLAIAGVYRVIETDLPKNLQNKAAKIELVGDTLKFQNLN